jgi:hypothetical protein
VEDGWLRADGTGGSYACILFVFIRADSRFCLFAFPAFEGVVEEGFHAAGLGGWRMPEVGRFVVGGIGSAAFEDAVKGEVEEGASGGGFDIRVLTEIPLVVEKAAAAVQAKDAPGSG